MLNRDANVIYFRELIFFFVLLSSQGGT